MVVYVRVLNSFSLGFKNFIWGRFRDLFFRFGNCFLIFLMILGDNYYYFEDFENKV